MSDKLKPCPFCGGEVALLKGLCELDNYVMCLSCRSKTKPYNTKETAINVWNTRKPIQKVLERLEEQQKIYKEAWENTDWIPDKTAYINRARGFEQAIEIIKEGVE